MSTSWYDCGGYARLDIFAVTFCLQLLVAPLSPGSRAVKYPHQEVPAQERTKETLLEDIRRAMDSGCPSRGVKGPSPLMNVRGFDVIWSFSPDYMHTVLLGVTRRFLDLWLETPSKPFYIGTPNTTAEIDSRIMAFKFPRMFSRLPKVTSLRAYWKAVEWESWLLYLSLPTLTGVLPDKYVSHFSLLVEAVYLLLQRSVTTDDIARSTTCLQNFVASTATLYTDKEMTSNLHLLLHLPKSVLLQGPLWAHSCFSFESSIGSLKELITSANGVPLQIASRILLRANCQAKRNAARPELKRHLGLDTSPRDNSTVVVLGKAKDADDAVSAFVRENAGSNITGPVMEHLRVTVNGNLVHSEQYTRPTRTDCTFVKFGSGSFGKIQHIVTLGHGALRPGVYAVCKECRVVPSFGTTHIGKARVFPRRSLHQITAETEVCIWTSLNSTDYICAVVANKFDSN